MHKELLMYKNVNVCISILASLSGLHLALAFLPNPEQTIAEINQQRNEVDRELNLLNSTEQQLRLQLIKPKKSGNYLTN